MHVEFTFSHLRLGHGDSTSLTIMKLEKKISYRKCYMIVHD